MFLFYDIYVLRQNVTGNKILSFRFLGLFFSNSMEAAIIKVSRNMIAGIKVLKEIYPKKNKTKKKVLNVVKMRFS